MVSGGAAGDRSGGGPFIPCLSECDGMVQRGCIVAAMMFFRFRSSNGRHGKNTVDSEVYGKRAQVIRTKSLSEERIALHVVARLLFSLCF